MTQLQKEMLKAYNGYYATFGTPPSAMLLSTNVFMMYREAVIANMPYHGLSAPPSHLLFKAAKVYYHTGLDDLTIKAEGGGSKWP